MNKSQPPAAGSQAARCKSHEKRRERSGYGAHTCARRRQRVLRSITGIRQAATQRILRAVPPRDLRQHRHRTAQTAVRPAAVRTVHPDRRAVGAARLRPQCRWAPTREGDRGTRVVLPARRGLLGAGALQHGQVLRKRRHQQLRRRAGRGRQAVRRGDARLLRRSDGEVQGRQEARRHNDRSVVRPVIRPGIRKPGPEGLFQLSQPRRKHGHGAGHGIHPSGARHRQGLPAPSRGQDLRDRTFRGRERRTTRDQPLDPADHHRVRHLHHHHHVADLPFAVHGGDAATGRGGRSGDRSSDRRPAR